MKAADLAPYVDRFPQARVLVIGDLMLDRYIWGEASRISQEAPVPVVRVTRETEVPGGAANVVRNILALRGQAAAAGVVGDDAHGRSLVRLLTQAGADAAGVMALNDRPTTIKTRVVANNQQVVRIDQEDTSPVTAEVLAAIEAKALDLLDRAGVHAVILEDYAKGLFSAEFMQRIVTRARQRRIPTALDPHPLHPYNVKGLHLMTPNRAEAFGLAGVYFRPLVVPIEKDRELIEVGRRLRDLWEVDVLLVTLGAGGMALFAGNDVPIHIPTRAREVFDVSGAGDTVIASYVMALLAGAGPEAAAHLANHAAGIVVGKVGTAPCPADELRAELSRGQML